MNTQNSPQGQGGFSMQAPAQVSTKLDTVQLLPTGPNPGILYSIVDIGTHFNEHFKKKSRLIRLTFEFPLFKQLFKTTDKEVRPTVLSMEETFQMAEKSNLKKFCDGALNRVLSPEEYKNGYDIGQFLNKVMIVNIVNKPSKRDTTKIYNNIGGVQGLSEHTRASYNFEWDLVVRSNDVVGFMIDPNGACFQSEAFASFPEWLRTRIMASDEAKKYASSGGIFIPKKERQVEVQANVPTNAPPLANRTPSAMPIVNGHILRMISQDYSYEAYLGNKWTNEALVAQNHAVWDVLPTQQAEQPAAPVAPSQPQAPQAPQAPVAPVAPDSAIDEVPF
jgi:hypothetical protein